MGEVFYADARTRQEDRVTGSVLRGQAMRDAMGKGKGKRKTGKRKPDTGKR